MWWTGCLSNRTLPGELNSIGRSACQPACRRTGRAPQQLSPELIMPIVSSLLLQRSLPIMTFLARFLPETLSVDGHLESRRRMSGSTTRRVVTKGTPGLAQKVVGAPFVTLMISIPRYIACPGKPLPMCQVRPRCVENLVISTRKCLGELAMPHLLPGATPIGGNKVRMQLALAERTDIAALRLTKPIYVTSTIDASPSLLSIIGTSVLGVAGAPLSIRLLHMASIRYKNVTDPTALDEVVSRGIPAACSTHSCCA